MLRNSARRFAGVFLVLSLMVLSGCAILTFSVEAAKVKLGMAVTELDRERVFNEENLKESFPQLAKNLRVDVADYIAGDYHGTVRACIQQCMIMALVNSVVALFMHYRFRRRWPTHDTEQAGNFERS